MMHTFNIPKIKDGDKVVIDSQAGHYGVGKDKYAFFQSFFSAVFVDGLLPDTLSDTDDDNPNIYELDTILEGGLSALNTTNPEILFAPPSPEGGKKELKLVINFGSADKARARGLKIDRLWMNNNFETLSEVMLNATKKKYPYLEKSDIKIEIIDWEGIDWIPGSTTANQCNKDGKPKVTLRLNVKRWEYLWKQDKAKELSRLLGRYVAYFESGLIAIKSQGLSMIETILDKDQNEKLKQLAKYSKYYELTVQQLLFSVTDYTKVCQILGISYEQFQEEFIKTQPYTEDAIKVFKSISAAGAAYFLRQSRLTDNLIKLTNPTTETKETLTNALTQSYSENRNYMLAKAFCFSSVGGALIDAVPKRKEVIQSHLSDAVVVTSHKLLNFSVEYRDRNSSSTSASDSTEQNEFEKSIEQAWFAVCSPIGYYNVYLALDIFKRLIALYASLLAKVKINKITNRLQTFEDIDELFWKDIRELAFIIRSHLVNENSAEKEIANRIYILANNYLTQKRHKKTFRSESELAHSFYEAVKMTNIRRVDLEASGESQAASAENEQLQTYITSIRKSFESFNPYCTRNPLEAFCSFQKITYIYKNIFTCGKKAHGCTEDENTKQLRLAHTFDFMTRSDGKIAFKNE